MSIRVGYSMHELYNYKYFKDSIIYVWNIYIYIYDEDWVMNIVFYVLLIMVYVQEK